MNLNNNNSNSNKNWSNLSQNSQTTLWSLFTYFVPKTRIHQYTREHWMWINQKQCIDNDSENKNQTKSFLFCPTFNLMLTSWFFFTFFWFVSTNKTNFEMNNNNNNNNNKLSRNSIECRFWIAFSVVVVLFFVHSFWHLTLEFIHSSGHLLKGRDT